MLRGSHHTEVSRKLISAGNAHSGGRKQSIFHRGHTTARGSCKKCQVRQQKAYQTRNRDRINAASVRAARYRRYDCIVYLGGVCVEVGCGYKTNLDGLQFDHARGKKAFSISLRYRAPWKALKRELDKCDLVCGTCHSIRTAVRRAT